MAPPTPTSADCLHDRLEALRPRAQRMLVLRKVAYGTALTVLAGVVAFFGSDAGDLQFHLTPTDIGLFILLLAVFCAPPFVEAWQVARTPSRITLAQLALGLPGQSYRQLQRTLWTGQPAGDVLLQRLAAEKAALRIASVGSNMMAALITAAVCAVFTTIHWPSWLAITFLTLGVLSLASVPVTWRLRRSAESLRLALAQGTDVANAHARACRRIS